MVQQNSPYNTLTPEDQIDGGADAENHLQVTVRSDFENGFKTHVNEAGETVSNLQNVQQIELINPNNQQYVFDGQNTESVKTWVLNNNSNQTGSLDLTDLPVTGIIVNILGQKSGAANIGFNADAVKGDSDAMTIGLENVGSKDHRVNLNTKAVEELAIVSSGAANWVDISKFDDAKNLTITGDADITIMPASATTKGKSSLPEPLRVIDATEATGDVTVHTGTIYARATYHGGSGNDTLFLDGSTVSNYMLHMDDVETLTINGNTTAISFDASNVTGVQTLNLNNGSAAVSFLHANQSELDVNNKQTDQNITIGGVEDVDVTFANIYTKIFTTDAIDLTLTTDTNGRINGTAVIKASDATTLTFNTGDTGQFDFSNAAAGIYAPDATSLTINTGDPGSAFILADSSKGVEDLSGVETIVITGSANSVDLSKDSGLGSNAPNLNVNAGQLNTTTTPGLGLNATFGGSSSSGQITITGAATGNNIITIGTADKSYYDEQITVVGSADGDNVTLYFASASELMHLVQQGGLDIDLGTGTNIVTFHVGTASDITPDMAAEVLDCLSGDGLALYSTVNFAN